jgi:hypothetical protein
MGNDKSTMNNNNVSVVIFPVTVSDIVWHFLDNAAPNGESRPHAPDVSGCSLNVRNYFYVLLMLSCEPTQW